MNLLSSSPRTALAAAAAVAAIGVATAVSVLSDGRAAAGTPHSSAPAPSTSTSTTAEPVVTPIAAAIVRGRIDIDRRHRSNVLTARLDFRPGDSTGWHSHPGAVLVQVTSGAVTLRHAAHGRCVTQVVRAGHGFFENPGAVHVAENRGPDPAVVYATFVLPPNAGPEVSAPIPAPCR